MQGQDYLKAVRARRALRTIDGYGLVPEGATGTIVEDFGEVVIVEWMDGEQTIGLTEGPKADVVMVSDT